MTLVDTSYEAEIERLTARAEAFADRLRRARYGMAFLIAAMICAVAGLMVSQIVPFETTIIVAVVGVVIPATAWCALESFESRIGASDTRAEARALEAVDRCTDVIVDAVVAELSRNRKRPGDQLADEFTDWLRERDDREGV